MQVYEAGRENNGRYDAGRRGRQGSLGMGDRLVIIFFVSLIIATTVVNFIPFSWINAMNVWSADYIAGYVSKSINYTTMFYYLLRLRGQIIGSVAIMIFSPFAKKVIYIGAAYLGLAWGIVSSIILMEHGINGLRICFFLVFPHFIFYGMGIGMLAYKRMQMTMTRRKPDITFFLVFVLAVLAVIAGVMAEAYVNTGVFKKIL